MERLAQRCAERITDRERVLDVGCGMGGTAALLAARGHVVMGIDPSSPAVAFGRAQLGNRDRLAMRAGNLTAATPASDERFDAIVLLEVRQYFPDLAALLALACSRLRPGGRIVCFDPVLCVDAAWSDVPFHKRGALREAALRAGLTVVEETALDGAVAAWHAAFGAALAAKRAELVARLRGDGASPPTPAGIEYELDEFCANVASLDRGHARGDLGYEEIVIEVSRR